ncbi:hypothetical protein IPC102_09680 [Pseudomonas aeruginosa]|uniref:hypothetical protein n=1 Tax=Pseudomonas aeruginosa TaxID=287 RepID=UPI000F523F80|nr:hypothetical protein [Pseudomonas aeruginosa]RQH70030.1 hypothetical protein IPC102_09680 [Pseudomonas aeruginosa]
MNPTHHTCCDCGYVWPHGADASHSCVRRLVAALAEQRQVTADAITGALASGAQGSPAPEPEHWLRPFYDIGRAEEERTQDLALLVRMLASALKRRAADSNLVARATNYLAAKGLAGYPMRSASEPPEGEQDERALLRRALVRAYMALTGYLPGHRNAITDSAIESARTALERSFPPEREEAADPRLIGWRTDNYLWETSDPDVAKNWEGNVGVLPIFEGDPNTKLNPPAAQAEQVHALDKQCRDDVARALGLTPQGDGFAWSALLTHIKNTVKAAQVGPLAEVPEDILITWRGFWLEEQIIAMVQTLARLRDALGIDDRDLVMAIADAGQCKARALTMAELFAAVPRPVANGDGDDE